MRPDLENNLIGTTTSKLKGPSQKSRGISQKSDVSYNEFKKIIDENGKDSDRDSEEGPPEIKISQHAERRIHEREIDVDGDEFIKLRMALLKLKDKGSKDSLVITKKGAYIIDVEKNMVVTAMDKKSVTDNIFTKIDSTLIVD